MSNSLEESTEEDKCVKLALKIAHDAILPMVVKSALELKIIDIISKSTADGSYITSLEIASQMPTRNPEAPVMLDRMLRLLAANDVLKCRAAATEDGGEERSYSAGPVCRILLPNKDGGSLGDFILMLNDQVPMKSWYHLNDSIIERGIPFNKANKMMVYEYLGTDPRFGSVFNNGQGSYSKLLMKKLVQAYKGFHGFKVLVDVGGGAGASIVTIVSENPHIKGINFDLPHVISEAPSYPGVEHIGGDMFTSVPKADGIMLKNILHNWGDDHCKKIIKNCYDALSNGGKLVVVDCVLPEIPENDYFSHVVIAQDVLMMAQLPEGKERTFKEFEAFAHKSGFVRFEVHNQIFNMWVMEFHKSA
nr:methyltransferase [Hypericum perforatum subsp. chinense]